MVYALIMWCYKFQNLCKMKAEEIYKYIASFIEIYDAQGNEVNPIPEDKMVTVYCEGTFERGFVENTLGSEIGLEALIAKSWILQDHLKMLTK
jgi:hypothetical protein